MDKDTLARAKELEKDIQQMELYDYDKDIPLAKNGDKYKVILIKKD